MYDTLKEFKTIIPKLLSDTNTLAQISKQSGITILHIHNICKMAVIELKDYKISAKEKASIQDFCKLNVEKAYSYIVDDKDDDAEIPVFDSEKESYGVKKVRNRNNEKPAEPKPVIFRNEYKKNRRPIEKIFIAAGKLDRYNAKPLLLSKRV